jgi:hypothetical protein
MSELPPISPPYPPTHNYYYPPPPPQPLPGSIKSLSIVAIVLGSLFLLCDCMGLANAVFMLAMQGKNPFLPNAPVINQPAVQAFLAADSLIKLALAGLLLAGGIGGLRVARWARSTLIWWSIAALIWSSISVVVQVAWTVPVTIEHTSRVQSQMNPQISQQNLHAVMLASGIATAVIGWAFWCALPVCFLLLWRSPSVRAAFEQTQPQQ